MLGAWGSSFHFTNEARKPYMLEHGPYTPGLADVKLNAIFHTNLGQIMRGGFPFMGEPRIH